MSKEKEKMLERRRCQIKAMDELIQNCDNKNVQRNRAYQKKYYQKHKEELLAKKKKYAEVKNMNENNSCFDCRYCDSSSGAVVCTKINEVLLGMKGCGNYVRRSPFDAKICPNCGKKVRDREHAMHECIKED